MVEKSKKSKKNEVIDAGFCETELVGNYMAIEGCKHSDKDDVNERKNEYGRGKEKKKQKKKKVTEEDSYKGSVERKKKDKKEEVREVASGEHHTGNVNERLEKKKKKRDKHKTVTGSSFELQGVEFEDAEGNSQLDVSKICGNVNQPEKEVETVGEVRKKKRKREKDRCVLYEGASQQDSNQVIESRKDRENENGEYLEKSVNGCKGKLILNTEKKKKKREKGKKMDGLAAPGEGILVKENKQRRADSTMNEKQDKNEGNGNTKGKGKEAKLVENGLVDSKSNKSSKKVRFSANLEVFPPSDVVGGGTEKNEDTLVRGKRFSKEEDEIVRQAVLNYIEENCLGEEGLEMVLNCRSHPKVRNCWKEIGSCIPYRPYLAVYYRAQILFRRSQNRKWTEEEYETLQKFYEQHGAKWKVLADELGKHRFHVKDAWRRIKVANTRKRGRWNQKEYQTLFELVNMDLVMRISEEKKSKHGMLRDNIPWSAISEKLSTRSDATCCLKWYNQLTSPMVAEGKWANADDYRLINALYQLDASCFEDVNWDNLLDHRSGDVCRKRWKQMVLHIGHHATKSFAEQVEVLAERYCPNLLDARVAWDNKPFVA